MQIYVNCHLEWFCNYKMFSIPTHFLTPEILFLGVEVVIGGLFFNLFVKTKVSPE